MTVTTYIYAFHITTEVGKVSGRVEATDHRQAQAIAIQSITSNVLYGNIERLKDQERARKQPYIVLTSPADTPTCGSSS